MILFFAQVRKVFAIIIGLFLICHSAFAQQRNASEILHAVRINPLGRPIALNARLRENTMEIPFKIRVSQGAVHYVFTNPDLELTLSPNENSFKLSEQTEGKIAIIKPASFDKSIRGTSLTYEDLALGFLYWPHPKLLGEDNIRTRDTWKIGIQAPQEDSQYGTVIVWLDKESGALLRIVGYDLQGHLVKKFEVISVQKIDGQLMLKQMRIEKFNPITNKVSDRAYLEVLGKDQ